MTRYRLTGRLETGELSELYAAIRGDEEAVVVKLFHPKTSDVRYAQELAETARVLATVKAPGIVRIIELGLIQDRLAIVRQAIDGLSLGQVLQRLTTKDFILPPAVALSVIVQVLDTVQRAHDAGVVHGALTPGNVLLTPAGAPAIFDFGALRALWAVPGLRKSFGGRGRDAYRAPEVAQGETPSRESDVYSLGAITYELLTLREPIADRSGTMSTRLGSLPPPSRLDRRLNSRLDPLVMRALEPQEGRRFRSAAEFASALRNFLANNGGTPPPEELRRFLENIRGRDPTQNLGPVPFAEPFVLQEVRGADLPPVTEKTLVVELRPSFSGARVDPLRETDPQGGLDGTGDFDGFGDTRISGTVTQPPAGMREPTFDEGTDPGHAGPLERGWDAPAGAAPPKPRAAKRDPSPVLSGRPVARSPRVKVIEDFSSPPTESLQPQTGRTDRAEVLPEPLPAPPPRPRASGPKGGLLPPPPSDLKGMEITGPLEYAALPADTHQNLPRPMGTAERFLAMDAKRRRQMLLVALGLAFIGAFSFALAVRRFGSKKAAPEVAAETAKPAQPYDPAYRTVNGALQKYFQSEKEAAAAGEAAPPPVELAPSRAAPEDRQELPARVTTVDDAGWHRPAPKDRAAYLSLSSDVAATVYIDDLKVRRKTPIVRYPVEPGVRRIVVQTASGDRRQYELAFVKGQLRRVEERFNLTRPER